LVKSLLMDTMQTVNPNTCFDYEIRLETLPAALGEKPCSSTRDCIRPRKQHQFEFIYTKCGITLIELLIAIVIIGILAALAVPAFSTYVERSRVDKAIAEIHAIQSKISSFQLDEDRLPIDLTEINWGTNRDPWGNPYQYTNFELTPKGKWRKDKFLVPINSTFDLWSMGPDGNTAAPLTAKSSKDDIIRANDGLFIGRASLY